MARERARAAGEKTYSTGRPCKHGHTAHRWVATSACCECVRIASLEYSRIHKERYNKQSTEWNKNHPEARSRIFRKYREKDPDRHRARSLKWAAEHPEIIYRYQSDETIRGKRRKTSREWQNENPERMAAHDRKYKTGHREILNAHARARHRQNPEKDIARAIVRRGREREAEGRLTAEDIETLLERQEYRCAAPHCRTDILRVFHCDHITPLSRGGSNDPENIQILCPTCNMNKGAKTMEEWIADRKRHAKADAQLATRLRRGKRQGSES